MASYADVEKYDQLIKALSDFEAKILEARENMLNNVKICQDIMGNDDISTRTGGDIQKACKQYLTVCTEVKTLRKKLSKERENIIKIINELNRKGS